MPTKLYIYGEDFVAGLTGPFSSLASAKEHLEFKRQRGDADICVHNNAVILTEEAAFERMCQLGYDNTNTPDEDRSL